MGLEVWWCWWRWWVDVEMGLVVVVLVVVG